jgi:hypothetical protein
MILLSLIGVKVFGELIIGKIIIPEAMFGAIN